MLQTHFEGIVNAAGYFVTTADYASLLKLSLLLHCRNKAIEEEPGTHDFHQQAHTNGSLKPHIKKGMKRHLYTSTYMLSRQVCLNCTIIVCVSLPVGIFSRALNSQGGSTL